jgi:hypothetical protein
MLDTNTDSQSLLSKASVVVLANHAVHEQIASALSWISAAIRHSPYDIVVHSSTLVSAVKSSGSTHRIAIRMAELKEIKTDQPCWHSLLPHAVIAKGFPIRERNSGIGLDINFADMALLSASMSFSEYEGGLVVEGLRSLLIPKKMIPEDNAIQWHLEYKRRSNPPQKRSVSQIFTETLIHQWHKVRNSEELSEKRCFLGWAEDILVMVGTRQFFTSGIFRSEASQTSMPCQAVGSSHNFGSPSVVPSTITFNIDRDILDTLSDELPSFVLIHDSVQRIGWFVPQLSFILDLFYRIVTKRGYRLLKGGREVAFTHAEPSADGANAALSALHELIPLQISKSAHVQEAPPNLIRSLLLVMEKVHDGVESEIAKVGGKGGSVGDDLYGVEYNELLKLGSPIDIKSVQVGQPWIRLMRSRNFAGTILCGGLEQPPIVPLSPEKLCSTWQTVPAGRNLLVTSGAILHTIIDEHNQGRTGARLGESVELVDREKNLLVESHTHGQSSPVFHEHSLRCVDMSSLDASIVESLKPYLSSGHVFADGSPRSPCSEPLAPVPSTIPNPAEFTVTKGHTPLSDVPEDDSSSEASNESENGFSNARLPTSSITSDEFPQAEKEPEQALISPSPGPSAATTWASKASSHDSAYVTDSSPSHSSSRQTSMSSSPSPVVPMTTKKTSLFRSRSKLASKGKGHASGKKTCQNKEDCEKSTGSDALLNDRRPIDDSQARTLLKYSLGEKGKGV